MTKTRTILASAVVIAGLLYAVGSAHPTFSDSLKHSHCCGPQPEDFRVYSVPSATGDDNIIIPEVEGTNGFIVTDILSPISIQIQQDSVTIFVTTGLAHMSFNTTGVQLVAGSTINILVPGPDETPVTLMGYVY